MAQSYEVIEMLRPAGGYTQVGEDYEGIIFLEAEPFSKEEYEAGFAQYDAWKTQQDFDKAAARTAAEAKLAALGLTPDDLKALGLGTN